MTVKPCLCSNREGTYETHGKEIKTSLNITWVITEKKKKKEKIIKKEGHRYLKPEICSIMHKHHQCSNTHVIATPRATHQPNGCEVMNDVSQKILWRNKKKWSHASAAPEGLPVGVDTLSHTERDPDSHETREVSGCARDRLMLPSCGCTKSSIRTVLLSTFSLA